VYHSTSDEKVDKENSKVKPNQYKPYSLHNDNANKRSKSKGGKEANHRTSSGRRIGTDAPGCKFRLPVFSDEKGFFLRGRNGCNIHSLHEQVSPQVAALSTATHILPEEAIDCLRVATQAHVGASTAANLLYAESVPLEHL
jgi:hypothetical protein